MAVGDRIKQAHVTKEAIAEELASIGGAVQSLDEMNTTRYVAREGGSGSDTLTSSGVELFQVSSSGNVKSYTVGYKVYWQFGIWGRTLVFNSALEPDAARRFTLEPQVNGVTLDVFPYSCYPNETEPYLLFSFITEFTASASDTLKVIGRASTSVNVSLRTENMFSRLIVVEL